MTGKTFVDTDFLIYAHDVDAKQKQAIAKDVLSELWADRTGVLSMQVLQESYVSVMRELCRPLMKKAARSARSEGFKVTSIQR
jgi:predicted nucleic acid-binding protein